MVSLLAGSYRNSYFNPLTQLTTKNCIGVRSSNDSKLISRKILAIEKSKWKVLEAKIIGKISDNLVQKNQMKELKGTLTETKVEFESFYKWRRVSSIKKQGLKKSVKYVFSEKNRGIEKTSLLYFQK